MISSGITAADDAVASDVLDGWIVSPPSRTSMEAEVVVSDLAGLSAGVNHQKVQFWL